MTAAEAKAETYKVRPPVRPVQSIYDAIDEAAKGGLRSISPMVALTEENQWWLEDEGYSFTTVENPAFGHRYVIIRIHW